MTDSDIIESYRQRLEDGIVALLQDLKEACGDDKEEYIGSALQVIGDFHDDLMYAADGGDFVPLYKMDSRYNPDLAYDEEGEYDDGDDDYRDATELS